MRRLFHHSGAGSFGQLQFLYHVFWSQNRGDIDRILLERWDFRPVKNYKSRSTVPNLVPKCCLCQKRFCAKQHFIALGGAANLHLPPFLGKLIFAPYKKVGVKIGFSKPKNVTSAQRENGLQMVFSPCAQILSQPTEMDETKCIEVFFGRSRKSMTDTFRFERKHTWFLKNGTTRSTHVLSCVFCSAHTLSVPNIPREAEIVSLPQPKFWSHQKKTWEIFRFTGFVFGRKSWSQKSVLAKHFVPGVRNSQMTCRRLDDP